MHFSFYLDTVLEGFNLLKVFSVGTVGVVKGSLEFPDVGFVLLLDAVDLSLVAGLNLHKGALELFNGAGTALSGKEIQTTIKLTTPNQLIQLILFPSDIQITHGDATE